MTRLLPWSSAWWRRFCSLHHLRWESKTRGAGLRGKSFCQLRWVSGQVPSLKRLLLLGRKLWVYFTMIPVPCPSPAIGKKGYFSDLYLKNLMGFLELTPMNMWGSPIRLWPEQFLTFTLKDSQSPVIHQNDHLSASTCMMLQQNLFHIKKKC